MKDSIRVIFRRVAGKKNRPTISMRGGKLRYITNATAKNDEKDLSFLLIQEAKKAGWEIPIESYIEVEINYDCLVDQIEVTITRLDDYPPKTKWGGRYDIQNIADTVCDALQAKGHDGVSINDNRITKLVVKRNPLISGKTPKKKND